MIMSLGYPGNHYNCPVSMSSLEGTFFLSSEINCEIISLRGKNAHCKRQFIYDY